MKILIASSIDPHAIRELETFHEVTCAFGAGEEELLEKMPGTGVLVFRSGVQINAKVLEAGAPDLCLLLRADARSQRTRRRSSSAGWGVSQERADRFPAHREDSSPHYSRIVS